MTETDLKIIIGVVIISILFFGFMSLIATKSETYEDKFSTYENKESVGIFDSLKYYTEFFDVLFINSEWNFLNKYFFYPLGFILIVLSARFIRGG